MSKKLCAFSKSFNTQYSLIYMLIMHAQERSTYRSIFMDLSKAFDIKQNHDLLLSRYVYGFSHSALSYMLSCFKSNSQRLSFNSTFSTWKEAEAGFLQGSILVLLFLNTFLHDVFYFVRKSFLSN